MDILKVHTFFNPLFFNTYFIEKKDQQSIRAQHLFFIIFNLPKICPHIKSVICIKYTQN